MDKKIVFTVICPCDEKKELPVVAHVTDNSEPDIQSNIDILCPFCGKYVRAVVDGELVDDKEIERKFGFRE